MDYNGTGWHPHFNKNLVYDDNAMDWVPENQSIVNTDSLTVAGSMIMTNTLVPVNYDSVTLGYTGNNVTSAVYSLAGNTVATLTIGYTGNLVSSVVRS
jgi:hypothetical protein